MGLVVGGLARLVAPYNKAELDFLSFSPELFFFLLLPPIIFEAGCVWGGMGRWAGCVVWSVAFPLGSSDRFDSDG